MHSNKIKDNVGQPKKIPHARIYYITKKTASRNLTASYSRRLLACLYRKHTRLRHHLHPRCGRHRVTDARRKPITPAAVASETLASVKTTMVSPANPTAISVTAIASNVNTTLDSVTHVQSLSQCVQSTCTWPTTEALLFQVLRPVFQPLSIASASCLLPARSEVFLTNRPKSYELWPAPNS